MKSNLFKTCLLATAVAAASHSAVAGEAVFYITEDGAAVNNISVTVNGSKKLVGKNGFVTFDLGGGNHSVELSQFGEWAGEFEFSASKNQNAEVQIEMIGGEAVQEVSVYTPGQEQAVALGKVSGYLESDETGGGVEGASISVEGTDLAVVTDSEGFYELEIPRGEYTLKVAHPNYGNREVKNLRVISNVATNVNLNMSMSGDSMIEEVVAVGSYIPSTATAQERDASGVLDAIGSEQMSRFGDSNAASALKRVAGVAIVGGKFAIVRGMSGRYTSSTLNGNLTPSTDPTRREVPLDLFPSSVLDGIAIQKSFTPDMPGDSSAGSIMLKTKGLPDQAETKISISTGGNSQTILQDVNTYEGGSSDLLGIDDGSRDLPSSVLDATKGGREALQVGSFGGLTPEELESLGEDMPQNYKIKSTTGTPDIGISLTNSNRFEGDDFDWAYFGAISYSNKWRKQEDGIVNDYSVDDATGALELFDEKEFDKVTNYIDLSAYFSIGMETHDGGEIVSKTLLSRKSESSVKTESGYDVSFEQQVDEYQLNWVERQYLAQQFSGDHSVFGDSGATINWRASYAQTNRNEPDRRTIAYRDGLFNEGDFARRYSELTEDAIDLGADFTMPIEFSNSIYGEVKTGLSSSSRDRDSEVLRFTFVSSNDPGSDVRQDQNPENILNDEYIDPTYYRLVNVTDAGDFYTAESTINAAYASVLVNFDEEYKLIFGARQEDSSQKLNTRESGAAFDDVQTNTLDQTDLLPMAGLTWQVNDEFQIRTSWSETVSRPDLTELSPASYFDPKFDFLVRGNPDLEIAEIENLDLRFEYYFTDDESITVALFNKEITNPIEQVLLRGSGSATTARTFENSESAQVSGLEFDFKKNILEGDTDSIFLSGNIAIIDSEVTLSSAAAANEGQESRELQGQSPYLINFQLGWDNLESGLELTAVFNHAGERISEVGRDNLPDIKEQPFNKLDLVGKYFISDDLDLKFKLENALNNKVTFEQGGEVQREYKPGVTFSTSISWVY